MTCTAYNPGGPSAVVSSLRKRIHRPSLAQISGVSIARKRYLLATLGRSGSRAQPRTRSIRRAAEQSANAWRALLGHFAIGHASRRTIGRATELGPPFGRMAGDEVAEGRHSIPGREKLRAAQGTSEIGRSITNNLTLRRGLEPLPRGLEAYAAPRGAATAINRSWLPAAARPTSLRASVSHPRPRARPAAGYPRPPEDEWSARTCRSI